MIRKKPSLKSAYNELRGSMEPGFNLLSDNPELEDKYLRYQGAVLDAKYKRASNFKRIDQLPKYERGQIDRMATRLAVTALLPPDRIQSRLGRIRILTVNSHKTFIGQMPVDGEFKDGLAVVPQTSDSDSQNHVLLHEIGHGLAITPMIVPFDDQKIISNFGSGLAAQNRTGTSIEDYRALLRIGEGIVDTYALEESNLDTSAYLSGKISHIDGYRKEVNALAYLAVNSLELHQEMHRAMYATGIQNEQQGMSFANAFRNAKGIVDN